MKTIRIRTDQAEAGMIVASDVYSRNQLIITKGTALNDKMITKLRFYNIFGLYVHPQQEEEAKEESYIKALRNSQDFKKFNRTYIDTLDHIEDSFHSIVNGEERINIEIILNEINRILKESRNGAHIMEMLHGIRNYDDMTFVHSMNVSLICNIFGSWLKLSPEDIKVLTLAGLLHDIGKMLIPKGILTKLGRLSEDEYEIIKSHSLKGYQILKDQPIDIRVKYAALMHHEKQDGSGYPNRFHGNQIDEFAKIVAIADVYDAMTSNRRYRKAICPFDAVESFEQDGFIKYDPKYLIVFLERIVESYLHNVVRLSDGREGEVVLINKLALSKPMIRIGNTFVDLSKEQNLTIEEII